MLSVSRVVLIYTSTLMHVNSKALRDFPVVLQAGHAKDSTFPALQWHRTALLRTLKLLATADTALQSKLAVAR